MTMDTFNRAYHWKLSLQICYHDIFSIVTGANNYRLQQMSNLLNEYIDGGICRVTQGKCVAYAI